MKTIQAKLPLASIVFALIASGCAFNKQVVLHPIESVDIVTMKKGEAYTPVKDGFFLSESYVSEVMNAKVEAIKRKS